MIFSILEWDLQEILIVLYNHFTILTRSFEYFLVGGTFICAIFPMPTFIMAKMTIYNAQAQSHCIFESNVGFFQCNLVFFRNIFVPKERDGTFCVGVNQLCARFMYSSELNLGAFIHKPELNDECTSGTIRLPQYRDFPVILFKRLDNLLWCCCCNHHQ
jgi:hypothetical protein